MRNALSFVSPHDTVLLGNTYNRINEKDHFNIIAETIIQDCSEPITINPKRDVLPDEKISKNKEEKEEDEGEDENDNEKDEDVEDITLFGIKLQNDTEKDKNTTFIYTNSQEEKDEWLSFLNKRVNKLKDPAYLAAQENDNMIVMDESGEWDLMYDDEEQNDRSTTMGVLRNIAINDMATDKSKPMIA